jgi:sterol desaturase/sphingolipid hydroxylase (fatty acid hydroxylase superfamily)
LRSETLFQLSLIGCFVALAIGELASRHRGEASEPSSDGRLLTNFGLTALVLLAGGLVPLARIASSLADERFRIGLANAVHLPWAAILAVTLLLDSFASYWVHRLMHATPLLWRVHRVHHADTAVDLSTSLRNHPLELLVTAPASALVIIVIGAPPSVILVAQAVLIGGALWQHAALDLPAGLDRALSLVLVTPRLHRVHHNPQRALHDSNFGDSIILWDRLFGTFIDSRCSLPVGLESQHSRPDHLLDQICSPIYAA